MCIYKLTPLVICTLKGISFCLSDKIVSPLFFWGKGKASWSMQTHCYTAVSFSQSFIQIDEISSL